MLRTVTVRPVRHRRVSIGGRVERDNRYSSRIVCCAQQTAIYFGSPRSDFRVQTMTQCARARIQVGIYMRRCGLLCARVCVCTHACQDRRTGQQMRYERWHACVSAITRTNRMKCAYIAAESRACITGECAF